MADNLMQASPQALRMLGLAPDDQPKPVAADTVQPSLQAIALAMRQSWRIGGNEARMAEFPHEYAEKDDEKVGVWERGARGIAAGFSSLIPASMTLAGGIIDFMGADEVGQGLAEKGIGVQEWLDQHVAVENPQFFDHLMMGVGSMASFLIPGIGAASAAGKAAQGLRLAGKAAQVFKAATGSGAMSFLEAAVEQSQRQQELMGQGMTAEQAMMASQPVFWQNMALLTVSNAAGYFSPAGKLLAGASPMRARAAQGVLAAFTEGGQERVQSVIQDVAAGRARWEDFFDPSKYQTETLVGAIVGGVAGGLTADTDQEPTAAQPSGAPAAPPPAGPTAPPPASPPPAGQNPTTSAPLDSDLALPEGFDLFTEPEEPAGAPTAATAAPEAPSLAVASPVAESPAEAAPEPQAEPPLVRTPEQRERPEWARKPEPPKPISTFENAEDGLRAEVYDNGRGGFAVTLLDTDANERVDMARVYPALAPAEEYARKLTEPKPAKPASRRPNSETLTEKRRRAAERKAREQAKQVAPVEDAPFVRRQTGWDTDKGRSRRAANAEVGGRMTAEDAAGNLQDVLPGVEPSHLRAAGSLEMHHVGDDMDLVPYFDVGAIRAVLSGNETAIEAAADRAGRDADDLVADVEAIRSEVEAAQEFKAARAEAEAAGLSSTLTKNASGAVVPWVPFRDMNPSNAAAYRQETARIRDSMEMQVAPPAHNAPLPKPKGKPRKIRMKDGSVIETVSQDEYERNLAATRDADGYFKGEPYKETGKILDIHGGKFLEVRWLSGPKKGELGAVKMPEPAAKPAPATAPRVLYNGSGRANLADAYAEGGPQVPLLGKGTYFADTREDAETYGPNIREVPSAEVAENPLTITNSEQWADLQRRAGVNLDPTEIMQSGRSDADVEADTQKLKNYVLALGHDGVAVEIPADADIDANGKSVKRLREAFGHTTVVSYRSEVAATESAPSEPAAVAEPAGSPASQAEAAPSNITTMPIETIATDPETFQVRSDKEGGGFDEDFVRNAVENFDEQAVNPIEVWLDPKTGKYTVIDGHHTLEILKRAGKKIATVKIFKGTRAQAIKASQERNDSRRANDPLARTAVVRGWREAGRTKKDIKAEASRLYGKDANTIIALSYLNPNGRVMETLRQFAGADQVEINKLLQMAKWIGTVRAADPKITDAHEQEMFDYLRTEIGKPGSDTETEFRKYIEGRIGGLGMFDYSQALNLRNAPSRTPAQAVYDAELAKAKREKSAAEAELKAKTAEYKGRPEAERVRLLKPYEDAVTIANREYMALATRATEIANIRSSEGSLFKILASQRRQFSKIADKYTKRGVAKNMTIAEDEVGPEADIVVKVAKRLGAKVVFFRAQPARPGGRVVGGSYNPATGTIFLNLEAVDREPLLVLAMHELGHHMQYAHPEQWRQLYFVALDNVSPAAKAVHEAMKAEMGYTPDQFAGELVSDLMEEAATRESFWNQLAAEHPSAFANAVAKIRDIIAAIKTVFAANNQFKLSPHLKSIQRMDAAIANAMRIAADRTAAGQQRAPSAQREMFKILPPRPTGRAVADRLKAERDGAKARIKARDRRWRDFPRVLYQKMVDRNTWHYVAMRKALKAAGIDVEKYDMAKNPHLVLQRMAAWTEKADLALRTAVLSWDGTKVLSDGLEVIIRKFNLAEAIDNGDFGLFLHAARMKAMHDVLGDDYFGPDTLPDGSPNPEYIAAEAEFNEYMEVYNHFGTTEWQDAATAMTEWSNAIMQRLLESGAISQEQYDGMVEKYDIYAPMYVLEREEENRTGAGTKPKPTAGRVTWQMDRLIPGQVRMDPVEGMIKNVYRIEFLAANNSAKLAAANFIADLHKKMTNRKGSVLPGYGRRVAPKVNPVTKYVGDLLKAAGLNDQQIQDLVDTGQVADLEAQAKMWVTSSYLENGVVALMRNGEVEYWQFEPDIYNVFASINDKASHQLMTYFTLQTRLLRAGAVLTPEFMARNQFRDFLSAGVLATHMVRNPVDAALLPIRIMRGLAHAIKKDDIWQQFIMSGAGQANLVALDQENLKKEVDQITREARTRAQRAGQAVRNPVKYIMHSHPVALLQAFSKLTENSTRLAVWEKTYNDAIAAGKSPANARAMAAIQAREASTDFGRAGEYGRVINRIIPFFNAAIQGNDKMVRALLVDKGNRGATWLRGTMMVTLPSVLLWAINRDEEWYKEQPAWLKNHFWLFSVDGGRTILKLPKPFEIGMIFGSLPERFLDYAYGEDPKAVGRWADSMLKDVGILQPGSFGGPLISTLVEIEQNYDAYRDTPIVKGWMQDVVPREQYTANTSEFAKWLGERYPGGRMSPLMVDHFIRGSFGGLGSWGAEVASNIIMEAEPERRENRPASRLMFDKIPDWAPVLRGIVQTGPTSYTQDLDDLYDEFDRTREAVTTLRSFKSGGAPKEKYLQLYRERGVDLALNEAVSRGVEPIAKISQQIKFIQSVPPSVMDRAEKRRRIDELMDMRNTLVREFMKKYRTIDRDSIQAQVEASVDKVGREFDRTKGR